MKIFIVDDEKHNREGLKLLLAKHYSNAEIVGEAESAEEARSLMKGLDFDLMLLDINMPKENGFDLLTSLTQINFQIIFITAYSEYAIRALKANAVDYILKPIDIDELLAALEKCKLRLEQHPGHVLRQIYADSVLNVSRDHQKVFPGKLTLPYINGFQIIPVSDIIYLEADGNYTLVFCMNQEKILVTKGIKDFEILLDPDIFFRTHKSNIINLNYLKEYSSNEGHTAILQNGSRVAISRRRIDDFMAAISKHSQKI